MTDFHQILTKHQFLSIEFKRWETTCYIIIELLNENKHVLSKENKALTFRHQWQAAEYLEEKYDISKEQITFTKKDLL